MPNLMQLKNYLFPKVFIIPLFVSFLIFIFLFGVKPGMNQIKSDFPNYYVSSKLLLQHNLEGAYSIENFNKAIQVYSPEGVGLFVMYPPTTALMMLPLAGFEIGFAKKMWLLISLIFMFHLVYLIHSILSLSFVESALLLFFGGFNLVNDLMLGQTYLFLLWLLIIGWHCYTQQNKIGAGLSWGLLAVFKFLPLFFLPFLIYKKEYKLAIFLFVLFMALHLLTYLVAGKASYVAFKNSFSENYLNNKVANQTPTSYNYQSMEALTNVKIEENQLKGHQNNFWKDVNLAWKLVWTIISIYFLFSIRKNKNFLQQAISSVILLLLLLEAGSASYHLLFCAFPLLISVQSSPMKFNIAFVSCWFFLGFLPTLLHHISISTLVFSFSRLWMLALFSLLFFYTLLPKNQKG